MSLSLTRLLPPVRRSFGPGGGFEDPASAISPITKTLNHSVGGLLTRLPAADEGTAAPASLPADLDGPGWAYTLLGLPEGPSGAEAIRNELLEVDRLFQCIKETRDFGREAPAAASGSNARDARDAREAREAQREAQREAREAQRAASFRAAPPAPDAAGRPAPAVKGGRVTSAALLRDTPGWRRSAARPAQRSHSPGSLPGFGTDALTRFVVPVKSKREREAQLTRDRERQEQALERKFRLEQEFYDRVVAQAQAADEHAERVKLLRFKRSRPQMELAAKLARAWLPVVATIQANEALGRLVQQIRAEAFQRVTQELA